MNNGRQYPRKVTLAELDRLANGDVRWVRRAYGELCALFGIGMGGVSTSIVLGAGAGAYGAVETLVGSLAALLVGGLGVIACGGRRHAKRAAHAVDFLTRRGILIAAGSLVGSAPLALAGATGLSGFAFVLVVVFAVITVLLGRVRSG